MYIVQCNITHAASIQHIAQLTWPATYSSIISAQQINTMLAKFYSLEVLQEQLSNSAHFFCAAMQADTMLGYAHCHAYEYKNTMCYKLSKLYVLPSAHGTGVGKALLRYCEQQLQQCGVKVLMLNVNRHNPAQNFYLRQGYAIVEEVDIPFEEYWLNDFIMQKKLC